MAKVNLKSKSIHVCGNALWVSSKNSRLKLGGFCLKKIDFAAGGWHSNTQQQTSTFEHPKST